MDGSVQSANQIFLDLIGYTFAEVRGRPHSLFVPPEERDTPAYRAFWDSLRILRARRAEQAQGWFLAEVRAGLLERLARPDAAQRMAALGADVAAGRADPVAAAAAMLGSLR